MMQREDSLLLDSLERIFRCLDHELENLKEVRSIQVEKLREMEEDVCSYVRMLEEISLPARMILEHMLELKNRHGQVAVETENVTQGFCQVRRIRAEKFGVLRINIGNLRLSWRDEGYRYLFYPDKVEIRALDEKTAIKLFFSNGFDREFLRKYSKLTACSNVLYLHPSLLQETEEERNTENGKDEG